MDGFSKDRVMILAGLSAGFAFSTDMILKGNSRLQINDGLNLKNYFDEFFQAWITLPEVKNKINSLNLTKISTA
jgi:hypothetical protein